MTKALVSLLLLGTAALGIWLAAAPAETSPRPRGGAPQEATGTVTGRVTDERGALRSGARVHALPLSVSGDAPSLAESVATVTDADGAYRLELSAGRWCVMLEAPGASLPRRAGREVEVEGATTSARDLGGPLPGGRWRGTLFDAGGVPAPAATVILRDARLDSASDGRCFDAPRGELDAALAPGRYRVAARLAYREELDLGVLDVGADETRRDLVLPGVRFAARFLLDNSNRLPRERLDDARFSLSHADGRPAWLGTPDGMLWLSPSLVPGEYVLHVGGSVRLAVGDPDALRVTVPPDVDVFEVEVPLSLR